MYNRVAQRDVVTSHNIQDDMSRSRKRTPISCWVCCKSQKRGKQVCNRKFRRREHQAISIGNYDKLPFVNIEVMNPWDWEEMEKVIITVNLPKNGSLR